MIAWFRSSERRHVMNSRLRAISLAALLGAIALGIGTSGRVEAGQLIVKEGTVTLNAPCEGDGRIWSGSVSKRILGEEYPRLGEVDALVLEESIAGRVYLQKVFLLEAYGDGEDASTLSHESAAKVTPTPDPFLYNVQALTTVTGGSGEYEQARGRWSVRGYMDLSCLRDKQGDRYIFLIIKGGFIAVP